MVVDSTYTLLRLRYPSPQIGPIKMRLLLQSQQRDQAAWNTLMHPHICLAFRGTMRFLRHLDTTYLYLDSTI